MVSFKRHYVLQIKCGWYILLINIWNKIKHKAQDIVGVNEIVRSQKGRNKRDI